MENIFKIKRIAGPGQLQWAVWWDGHGIVYKEAGLRKIWDAARAHRKTFSMGISFEKGVCSFDAGSFLAKDADDMIIHFVKTYGGVNGAAFVTIEEAEAFVEALEKHVAWSLLKREYTSE